VWGALKKTSMAYISYIKTKTLKIVRARLLSEWASWENNFVQKIIILRKNAQFWVRKTMITQLKNVIITTISHSGARAFCELRVHELNIFFVNFFISWTETFSRKKNFPNVNYPKKLSSWKKVDFFFVNFIMIFS
jgi:regulator of PEP synthase PpsR (kinase-PPPase family)